MVMLRAGSFCVVSLATALLLFSPPAIEAQESEGGLNWREIGLVGLTVDLPDEQNLGRNCRWRNDPASEKPRGECWLSRVTLRDAGVPVVDVAEISLSDGIFGRERYRLAGRITLINLRSTSTGATSQDTRWARARAPREAMRDENGVIVGYTSSGGNGTIVNYSSGGRKEGGDHTSSTRQTRAGSAGGVQAKVVWSLYDSFGSNVIVNREIRAQAADLGGAVFASLEEFVDGVSKEMEETARD